MPFPKETLSLFKQVYDLAKTEESTKAQMQAIAQAGHDASKHSAAMFDASFLLAMTLSSEILRTNLHITAFGLLKLCEEELDERYQNH